MKTFVFTIFLLFFSNLAIAGFPTTFDFADFNAAEKADSFLKFEGISKKAGMFSSTFTGFVKNFSVDASTNNSEFTAVKVNFKTESLDTDIDARNEKMWDKCLDYKNHKEITIQVVEPIKRKLANQKVNAKILIRGVERPISIIVSTSEDDNMYQVTGETFISVKETEIPDPSIFVAKLNDTIKIFFNLKIAK